MLFTEINFLYFVFCILLLLAFGNKTYKKIVLLTSSYFFYGYWDWRFLSLIWISTIVDYMVGKAIYSSFDHKKRKRLLFISIITNLGILGFFKYFNFFIDSYNHLFGNSDHYTTLNIILPIGISFYTFQTMSYTIDIYRKKIQPTKSILDFSNFVAFFPQLVAGPIERATNLLGQMGDFNGSSRKYVKTAFVLLFIGYVKKVLIADNIGSIVDPHFTNYFQLTSFQARFALILFSLQIYFDFSGYSDIARGLAFLLGIKLMINFNQPYFSKSPSEFWRRWHISLSTWLRDYLYIPLGGNRCGSIRTNINLMVTMLLGGLWHGASWNFVLWGGLHGIYLIFNKIIANSFPFKRTIKNQPIITFWKVIFTYTLILITWLPFRVKDFNVTYSIMNKILFWTGGVNYGEIILVFFFITLFLAIDLPAYFFKTELFLFQLPKWLFWAIISIGTSGVIYTILTKQNSAMPFIYFQF